jgi:hypothetical protein
MNAPALKTILQRTCIPKREQCLPALSFLKFLRLCVTVVPDRNSHSRTLTPPLYDEIAYRAKDILCEVSHT